MRRLSTRRDREKKLAATAARKAREARLPKFSKLAFQAQHSRQKGKDALAVLQDALLESYGPQFRFMIRKAKARRSKRGVHSLVVFAPSMERAYHKWWTVSWYMKQRWPFSIETNRSLRTLRPTAVVVWDSDPACGFNAHHWVRRRQEQANEPKGRQERETMAYAFLNGYVVRGAQIPGPSETMQDSRIVMRQTLESLTRKGYLRQGDKPSLWYLTTKGREWAENRGWQ